MICHNIIRNCRYSIMVKNINKEVGTAPYGFYHNLNTYSN